MKSLSDKELLEELKNRIDERRQAYEQLEKVNDELHEANRKLMESEKLKSNFLSNARNEVINPLASILSLSQTIASGEGDGEDAARLAEIIYQSAFDLDFQMKNIFSSAEIEAGETTCEYYTIDIAGMIEKTIAKFSGPAMNFQKTIIFENQSKETAQSICSDPSKIQLILDNLILNAINWSKNDGDIKISQSVDENMVEITVSDPGPGIELKDQEEIFNRFKSLDPAVHTLNKGHGLGLSIVKSYVEMLDGTIAVESSPDSGSTFRVKIKNQVNQPEHGGTSDNGSDFLFDENAEVF
jgi:signal transduction histidine kinase